MQEKTNKRTRRKSESGNTHQFILNNTIKVWNWKTSGHDGIFRFRVKKFTSIHDRLALEMTQCVQVLYNWRSDFFLYYHFLFLYILPFGLVWMRTCHSRKCGLRILRFGKSQLSFYLRTRESRFRAGRGQTNLCATGPARWLGWQLTM